MPDRELFGNPHPLRKITYESDDISEEDLLLSHLHDKPCPDFGCPLYPPELTSYLKELIVQLYNSSDPGHQAGRDPSNHFYFGTNRWGMLTQKGLSHTYNQDRSVVLVPFRSAVQVSDQDFLIGLFDGHGEDGHIVADQVARDFPERLANKFKEELSNPGMEINMTASIIRILKETFVEIDEAAPPSFLLGGCTASVTLRRGEELFIANAGDSQTIVFNVPKSSNPKQPLDPDIVFKTRKDKAILPDEYARIVALNGSIHINPKTNDSRVVVRSDAAHDVVALAMSRSIGDWEWKPVGVIAEPLVDVIDMKKNRAQLSQSFLIAASDGIWDVRRSLFYAKHFQESYYPTQARQIMGKPILGRRRDGRVPPLFQCSYILEKITPKIKRGYCDDMTVIAMKL